MKKFYVTTTIHMAWEVEANSKKEAIEIARDLGEAKCSFRQGKFYATDNFIYKSKLQK